MTSERRQRGPATFRQRDVVAAVKATERAGKTVREIRIDRNGSIRIIIGEAKVDQPVGANPWDELFTREDQVALRQ